MNTGSMNTGGMSTGSMNILDRVVASIIEYIEESEKKNFVDSAKEAA